MKKLSNNLKLLIKTKIVKDNVHYFTGEAIYKEQYLLVTDVTIKAHKIFGKDFVKKAEIILDNSVSLERLKQYQRGLLTVKAKKLAETVKEENCYYNDWDNSTTIHYDNKTLILYLTNGKIVLLCNSEWGHLRLFK